MFFSPLDIRVQNELESLRKEKEERKGRERQEREAHVRTFDEAIEEGQAELERAERQADNVLREVLRTKSPKFRKSWAGMCEEEEVDEEEEEESDDQDRANQETLRNELADEAIVVCDAFAHAPRYQ